MAVDNNRDTVAVLLGLYYSTVALEVLQVDAIPVGCTLVPDWLDSTYVQIL